MKVSMRIAKRREELGMKQKELADAVGIDYQRIWSIENDRIKDIGKIHVSLALRIAKALKTTVEKLFA